MPNDEDELLADQRAFYRARASQYDDWWQRRGAYDHHDHDQTEDWHRQVHTVEQALATFDPAGDVLELAGGTGWWTERLARTADRLTVVDSSPETLAINRDEPAELHERLEAAGWEPAIEATRWFLYGSARPRRRM